MHPAARLFQPRVKNGSSNIMTLDASDEFPHIGFEHSSPALAFPHQIAATDVMIALSREFVWPHAFQKFGSEHSGENPFFSMF